MGTNFYAGELWPNAEDAAARRHLFKRSAAGVGRLRFTWAMDLSHVALCLLSVDRAARVFDGENESAGDVLADIKRIDTIHDYSLVGQDFS